ncbi:MAG: PTS sugar transporter subunit IIB [Anaerolineaceae bacterium]|nr:PTS sugar transporter subunit IIB [Anaerolineaceae bacterium]
MIQLIRIDDRLLHGQVIYSWKASLDYQAIVIADDVAAADELRKKVIKLATPPGVKSITLSIEEACKFLQTETLQNVKIFVVVASPKAAYEILQCTGQKCSVNLGGMMKTGARKEFAKAVYLENTDLEYLEKIEAMKLEVDVRQTPGESQQNFQSLKSKFK